MAAAGRRPARCSWWLARAGRREGATGRGENDRPGRRARERADKLRAVLDTRAPRRILVVDVGGTHVKLLATGVKRPRKLPSGPELTAGRMVRAVLRATADWEYDAVSLGYPGPVRDGRPR